MQPVRSLAYIYIYIYIYKPSKRPSHPRSMQEARGKLYRQTRDWCICNQSSRYVHSFICIHPFVYVCICIHTRGRACMYVYMYEHATTPMLTECILVHCIQDGRTIYIAIYTYIHMYVHTMLTSFTKAIVVITTHACIYACICICMYVCMQYV